LSQQRPSCVARLGIWIGHGRDQDEVHATGEAALPGQAEQVRCLCPALLQLIRMLCLPLLERLVDRSRAVRLRQA
jgi:hypothetical protein